MLDIYIDADACPVKHETYKVAGRSNLNVIVVSNTRIQTPRANTRIRCVTVGRDVDAVDDWIAENIGKDDICITADVPLAARCLKVGAHALGPRGKSFTEESIGDALSMRDLMLNLRESGLVGGGPPPFAKKDRSKFLDRLDQIIQEIRKI